MSTLTPQQMPGQGQLSRPHEPAQLKDLLGESQFGDLPGGSAWIEPRAPSDDSFHLVRTGGVQVLSRQEHGSHDHQAKLAGDCCGEPDLVLQTHPCTTTPFRVSPGGVRLMRQENEPTVLARPGMLALQKLVNKLAG